MRPALFLIAALLLGACGASAPPASLPIPLPTAVPLSAVDLEPLLIQSGDLPSGLGAAQVSDTPPKMFASLPKAIRAIDQRIQRAGATAGGITVLLYDDPTPGYQALIATMGATDAVAVGEQSRITRASDLLPGFDVALVRCHAVVYVRMTGDVSAENVLAYAKRLDARLSNAVC